MQQPPSGKSSPKLTGAKTGERDSLRRLADQCVLCGMCLPHCPTYRLAHRENESPRGRIGLMLGLAEGALLPEGKIRQHLGHCLSCGACEAMCPSQVPFTALMDQARGRLGPAPDPGPIKWFTGSVLPNTKLRRSFGTGLRLMQKSGLTGIVGQMLDATKGALRSLPPLSPIPNWSPSYAAQGTVKGTVGLFLGCGQEMFDSRTLSDAIELLQHCGWNVLIPRDQGCCGALAAHSGDPDTAARLADRNSGAFGKLEISHIVHTASGCLPQAMRTQADGPRPIEICQFLLETDSLAGKPMSACAGPLLLHEPCTHRNSLGGNAPASKLLALIPSVELGRLDSGFGCCGAAGDFMLREPAIAAQFRAPLLDAIRRQQPAVLVSTNVGCAIHLASGIREAGLTVDLRHPVSLLLQAVKGSA